MSSVVNWNLKVSLTQFWALPLVFAFLLRTRVYVCGSPEHFVLHVRALLSTLMTGVHFIYVFKFLFIFKKFLTMRHVGS